MLNLPPIYPITSAASGVPLAAQVRSLGEAGFPLVQFRGKPLDARAQWEQLRIALRESAENGGWPLVVVNDRADLAVLAAREGLAPWGLHLGQTDLPPGEARRLPGLADLHLGTSTHSPAEWDDPDPACDHAGAGPFRATASKPDHAPPIGAEGLGRACAALAAHGLAAVAIGGLQPDDAETCLRAGAESLAMAGAVEGRDDPGALLWEVQATRWRVRPPLRHGQGVLLAGSSGAGKSTFARALACRLGLPALDLDERIVAAEGMDIARIFAERGEGAFRVLEAEHLACLLGAPAVVALGGGAWESETVRATAVASGFQALWLAETPARCWGRAGADPDRPLAASRPEFLARHRQRLRNWSRLACVLPLGRSPEALAEALTVGID